MQTPPYDASAETPIALQACDQLESTAPTIWMRTHGPRQCLYGWIWVNGSFFPSSSGLCGCSCSALPRKSCGSQRSTEGIRRYLCKLRIALRVDLATSCSGKEFADEVEEACELLLERPAAITSVADRARHDWNALAWVGSAALACSAPRSGH